MCVSSGRSNKTLFDVAHCQFPFGLVFSNKKYYKIGLDIDSTSLDITISAEKKLIVIQTRVT